METLEKTNPHFVRCIKSNNHKAPCLFDEELVLRQLRYTGMVQTVRIRKAGYSVRITFEVHTYMYMYGCSECRFLLLAYPTFSPRDVFMYVLYWYYTFLKDFYEKYQFLMGVRSSDLATQIDLFLKGMDFTPEHFQVGTTKVRNQTETETMISSSVWE